jgi:hypothetical protein
LDQPKDSIIEERVFLDEGEEFRRIYKNQTYREEMSLNLENKLYLIIDNISFFYDFTTNKMNKLYELNEKHSAGALVSAHNNLYCVLGRTSVTTEKFNLTNYNKFPKGSWEVVNSDCSPRAYFSTFIQNERMLYILFGYDFSSNEYIKDFKKMDLLSKKKKWKEIEVSSNKIPKLSLAATIVVTNEKVYILGKILINLRRNV